MITCGLFSSATDMWETPKDFFNALDKEFHFTCDVCAIEENAKCAKFYTPEQDGLKQTWGGMLDEPALRQGNPEVGEEGKREQSNSRMPSPCANRYAVVS